MLGTAQTNTFCAEASGFLSISRSISIGTDTELAVFVSPFHNTTEFAADRSINGRDNTVIDITGRTIERNIIAFDISLASQLKFLVFFIHVDFGTTGYTAGAHTTCNNSSVRGHTATNGQDTLSSFHTFDVLGRSFQTNQYNLFTFCSPLFCVFSSENNTSASSTGRSSQSFCYRNSSLQLSSIKLRMEKHVQSSRIDHCNCFFVRDHAFVN